MLLRKLTFILPLLLLIVFINNATASAKNHKALFFPRNYAEILLEDAESMESTEAIELIKKSLILFPDNPEAYFLMSQKSSKPLMSVKYYFTGVYYTFLEIWHLLNINAILIISISSTLLLILIIFFISRTPYIFPLITHEIAETPKKVVFIALLIPSIFGFYFALSGLLFFVLLYIRKRGHLAGLIIFSLMFLSLLGFRFFHSYINVAFSPEIRSIVSVNTGQSTTNALKFLQDNNEYSMFTRGLLLQKMKRLDEAKDIYERLLKRSRDHRVLINLAGVNLMLGNLDEAESLTRQALNSNPSVTAYYNMSIIKREQLDFQGGDDNFIKAINMDFDKVTLYREFLSAEQLPLPMVESLTKKELLSIILSRTLQNFRLNKESLLLFPYTIVLILLLFFRQRNTAIPMQCKKCGRVFCLHCERRLHWRDICSDCFKNLITLEKTPEERIKAILMTYEYQQRRRKITTALSFIIPGFAILVTDRFLRGLFILFCTVLSLSIVFATGYFNVNIQASDFLSMRLSFFIIALLIYTFSLFYIRRRIKKGWL